MGACKVARILRCGAAPCLHLGVVPMGRRLLLIALAIFWPAVASAAEIGTITIQLQIEEEPGSFRDMSPTEEAEFFNSANCECRTPVGVELTLTNAPTGVLPDDEVELWVGADCNRLDDADRENRCSRLRELDGSMATITVSQLRGDPARFVVDSSQIMWPNTFPMCGSDDVDRTIWALVEETDDTMYDHEFTLPDISVDTEPPPTATVTSEGGEGAAVLEWDFGDEDDTDVKSYQVLCARKSNGQPIFTSPKSEPKWEICGDAPPPVGNADAGPGMADAAPADAAVAADAAVDASADAAIDGGADAPIDGPPPIDGSTSPDGGAVGCTGTIADLDPCYVCSSVLPANQREARIEVPSDLQLGASDAIVLRLLVIDDHRNVTVVNAGEVRPEPVQDFWEVYEDQGGSAEGGFCFVATAAYGDYDHPFVLVLRDFRDHTLAATGAGRAFIAWYYRHSPAWADFLRRHPTARTAAAVVLWPIVVAAGAWEYTTAFDKLVLFALALLASRRVRRRLAGSARTRITATACLALVVGGARAASAQVVFDEDAASAGVGEEPPRSEWGFELKFGPYTPDIDNEFDCALDTPGCPPYKTTFGDDWSLMTQIEVDRYFVYPLGQLGVAASIGYMSNSAAAFKQRADGSPDYGERSTADDTGFRLVPLSVSAVYRFTRIADDTVVPLVPYLKLGASYYIWWITKGDGDITENPTNGDAYGGTLGWQASLGLAVRAEQLDPGSARNLESELGVEHAGFFFELTYADLDRADRLHVGDFTWFAGINFEF